MKKYWFEFNFRDNEKVPYGLSIGCGVTAFNYEDAINIIQKKIFTNSKLPNIVRKVEAIDISTLDQGHVIPNMNPPNNRGIWFPIGYD